MTILMIQMLAKGFYSFFSLIGILCYPTDIVIHCKTLDFALQVFTQE